MKTERNTLISILALRRTLGILGMVLPFACWIGGLVFAGLPLQQSISFYYHTHLRDLLVGVLVCMAIFLFCYKGYTLIDDLFTWAIGIAGLLVALFPCPIADPAITRLGLFQVSQSCSGTVHFWAAGAFFGLLALNSIFLFTRSDQSKLPRRKFWRNVIYISCGIIILACLATLIVLALAAPVFFAQSSVGFVMETVMLWAFGLAWLTKGETLLRDAKNQA